MNDEGKDILSEYLTFKDKILKCYNDFGFDREKFESLGLKGGIIAQT